MRKTTEKQFMAQVVQFAKLCGWMAYHTHDSRRCVPGFPDLVLVKPGRGVVYAELKVGKNGLTPEQSLWLEALRGAGQAVYVWRPEAWGEVVAVLTGGAGDDRG